MATQHPAAVCAKFHRAIELIGARWTGALLLLLMNGPARYCTLRDAVPEISDRMLSERLRALEQEEIVERVVFPDTPVRIEYRLTAKGEALEPVMKALGKWADKFVEADPKPAARTGAAATPSRRARG